MVDKRCPLCSNHFDCKDSGECWCWGPDVAQFIPRLTQISKSVSGCICRKCLMNLPPLRPKPQPPQQERPQ